MEGVPAGISGQGFEVQSGSGGGGGGGSKLPENSPRITQTGLTALVHSKRGNENYELGLRAGLGYCNALDPRLFLQIAVLHLDPVIQAIAKKHQITAGSLKMFEEGFLDARALVSEKLTSVTNTYSSAPSSSNPSSGQVYLGRDRVKIADEASEIVEVALSKIKDNKSGNRCYDLGFKAGWTFLNQLNPLLLTYFELLETNSIIQSFSKKFTLEGVDLEKFKEGFSFFKAHITEKLEAAKLLAPEDEKSGFIKRGEAIAKIYYDHPSNRNSLVELFLDRSKLIKVFYQVMQQGNLYLEYAKDVPELTYYKDIMAHSIDLAIHAECFSNAMSAIFKENQIAIESLMMDPEDLAKSLSPEPPKKNKKKKKAKKSSNDLSTEPSKEVAKVLPPTPKQVPVCLEVSKTAKLPAKKSAEEKREEFAHKQKQDFENKIKAGFSKVRYDELQGIVKTQEAKVKKMQLFLEGVSDPAKIADLGKQLICVEEVLQHHRAEFAKVTSSLTAALESSRSKAVTSAPLPKVDHVSVIEKREFSTHIRTVIETILCLINSQGHPINLEGTYTDFQMQTFKICVLYMINRGFFINRLDNSTLTYVASELSTHLPSNKYTPPYLDHQLWNGELDVLRVFVVAGFTFSI